MQWSENIYTLGGKEKRRDTQARVAVNLLARSEGEPTNACSQIFGLGSFPALGKESTAVQTSINQLRTRRAMKKWKNLCPSALEESPNYFIQSKTSASAYEFSDPTRFPDCAYPFRDWVLTFGQRFFTGTYLRVENEHKTRRNLQWLIEQFSFNACSQMKLGKPWENILISGPFCNGQEVAMWPQMVCQHEFAGLMTKTS